MTYDEIERRHQEEMAYSRKTRHIMLAGILLQAAAVIITLIGILWR